MRNSETHSVTADSQRESDGPFFCPECSREVVLRTGSVRITHFAHRISDICRYGAGETDDHRRCKKAIYEALLREPGVKNVILEHSLKTARPDVSAEINNIPVAIEVQISTLSMETIIRRTEEYARQGIYVLWLLPGLLTLMGGGIAQNIGRNGFMPPIPVESITGSKVSPWRAIILNRI